MPRKQERFIRCVYLIGFKSTDKVYIGSTIRWPYREREHLTDLALGKHHNQHLQRAYDKHGGVDSIYIKILETYDCSEEDLRRHEETWIERYQSANPDKGYNMVPFPSMRGSSGYIPTPEHCERLSRIVTARCKDELYRDRLSKSMEKAYREHPERFEESGFKIMTYSLYDPDGQRVAITNLHRFCRKHGLEYGPMHDVASDIRIEYRGWKKTLDREHRRKNHYDLIGPDGEKVQGVSIRQLCLARDLPYRSMCAMVRGEQKTCAGYRRADTDERVASIYKGKDHVLVSPSGQEITVNNLAAFCREHGIHPESLRKGYVSKGWSKKASA